jgi:hypothetical protein
MDHGIYSFGTWFMKGESPFVHVCLGHPQACDDRTFAPLALYIGGDRARSDLKERKKGGSLKDPPLLLQAC